ncbi:MAG: WecB/TagA/CpsF family glycosyltransferase [Balneolaceae bacterium]|nr:WecB/TagA/CpsF family glycosyltransferase [Balneolaceae bacterium]
MLAIEKNNGYQVLGVTISTYSKEEFFFLVQERLKDNDENSPPVFVVTVNPEIAIQSIIDNDFKEVLKTSTINTADGVGISWAIKFLYSKKIDRITGSDSFEKICTYCAELNQPAFFYGAAPGIARKASDILTQRIKNLHVSGVYSPDKPNIPFEDLPLGTQASLHSAAVVFVALGAPSQEKWIHENLGKLPNCKLIIGIGGSFDFITGNIKRAPLMFQKTGLEWMYRLYLQPARWRRMLRLPLFALNVMLLKTSSLDVQKPAEL